MAMLRVAASFWRAVIRYWRIGNLRADGLGAAFCEWEARVSEVGLTSGLPRSGSRIDCPRECTTD
jgi:hypothetical protein